MVFNNWKILELGYVYVGDSYKDYTIDLGFNKRWIKRDLRLHGIDTPELRGYQKFAGDLVRDYIINLHRLNPEACYWIHSFKDEQHKYGEILVNYYIENICINKHLIEKKYAKEYFGGKKEPWTQSELDYIINDLKWLNNEFR